MAMEVLLTFNGESAFSELGKAFESVVRKMTDVVMQYAEKSLPDDSFYTPVKMTLQARLVSVATSGVVSGQVGTDAWEAFIAEWGSGSEMDRVNPQLAAYMSSALWNPERAGFAITGRPEGPYLALDGTIHTSSGKLSGVDLEALSATDSEFQAWMLRVGLPSDAFQPKPPYYFMKNALEAYRTDILMQLNQVLSTFSFGSFFV